MSWWWPFTGANSTPIPDSILKKNTDAVTFNKHWGFHLHNKLECTVSTMQPERAEQSLSSTLQVFEVKGKLQRTLQDLAVFCGTVFQDTADKKTIHRLFDRWLLSWTCLLDSVEGKRSMKAKPSAFYSGHSDSVGSSNLVLEG